MILQNITSVSAEKLTKDLFLVLLKATSIPPHLGLCYKGNYYSLTNKGLDINRKISSILELVERKKLATLFIEISTDYQHDLSSLITSTFSQYQTVTPPTTCLFPIKSIFEKIDSLNLKRVEYIFDLLPVLKETNRILNVFHSNMKKDLVNNSFELRTYNKQQIFESISPKQTIC